MIWLTRYGSPVRWGIDNNPGGIPPPSQSTQTRRFSVNGHHISWLGFEMDFHFSSLLPFQLYNIKFNGETWVNHIDIDGLSVVYYLKVLSKFYSDNHSTCSFEAVFCILTCTTSFLLFFLALLWEGLCVLWLCSKILDNMRPLCELRITRHV